MATRVAVQQQQRLFREGLRELLEVEDDLEVAGTAVTSKDLLQLCAETCPELVLLEADTSSWDVAKLCGGLRRVDPGVRLVGLSAGSHTAADQSAAQRCGMSVLVSRSTGIAGVLAALRATAVSPQLRQLPVFRSSAGEPARALLTARELHVLNLVGAGYTSREMSARLNISHKTVENHKQRIFAKLGVQNQAHAISVAMRAGLLRADQVIDLAVR